MPLRKSLVATALVSLLAFAGATTARAAVTPPTLVGETFTASSFDPSNTQFFEVNLNCGAEDIFFSAAGLAAGNYPGTFTESGDVILSPTGQVLSFSTTFTIMSPVGTVHGSKSLGSPPGTGTCSNLGLTFDAAFDTPVNYAATIYPATGGVFTESGTGNAQGERAEAGILAPVVGADQQEGSISTFSESFLTSNGILLGSTGGHVTGGGFILDLTTTDRVSFGFEVKGTPTALHGTCEVIDHVTKTMVHCLTADTLVVAGTDAIFTGQASVNGGAPQQYTIEVHDMGEPGTLDDFSISTGSYSAAGPLVGGNIQIHSS